MIIALDDFACKVIKAQDLLKSICETSIRPTDTAKYGKLILECAMGADKSNQTYKALEIVQERLMEANKWLYQHAGPKVCRELTTQIQEILMKIQRALWSLVDLVDVLDFQCQPEKLMEKFEHRQEYNKTISENLKILHNSTQKLRNIAKDIANQKPTGIEQGLVSNTKIVGTKKRKSKYTPEKIKNMEATYYKHLEEKNSVKYAWECVADEHDIKSAEAAQMAVRRYREKNK